MDQDLIKLILNAVFKRKYLIISTAILFGVVFGALSKKKNDIYIVDYTLALDNYSRYQDVLDAIESNDFSKYYIKDQGLSGIFKSESELKSILRAISLNGGRTIKISLHRNEIMNAQKMEKSLVSSLDKFMREKDMAKARSIVKRFQETSLLNKFEKEFVEESLFKYKEILFNGVVFEDYIVELVQSNVTLKKSKNTMTMVFLGLVAGFFFSFCMAIVIEINLLKKDD